MILIEENTVDNIKLEIFYLDTFHKYKVIVSKVDDPSQKLENTFNASFEPKFGMDIDDAANAYSLAEEMAQELEK